MIQGEIQRIVLNAGEGVHFLLSETQGLAPLPNPVIFTLSLKQHFLET